LDGHDRGAKIVARILRDAGYEVIYTGIRQTPDQIAEIAMQEDVDAVGLSILSGAHIGVTRRVVEALAARGISDVPVVVGGTVPDSDVEALQRVGAAAVFPTGTSTEEIISGLARVVRAETSF
jgi:methylmalonyl-CoA mutase C-terminal domain/subunit